MKPAAVVLLYVAGMGVLARASVHHARGTSRQARLLLVLGLVLLITAAGLGLPYLVTMPTATREEPAHVPQPDPAEVDSVATAVPVVAETAAPRTATPAVIRDWSSRHALPGHHA